MKLTAIQPCKVCGTNINHTNMYRTKENLWATKCPKCGRKVITQMYAQFTWEFAVEEWNKQNTLKKPWYKKIRMWHRKELK